jgi:Glyoxalase-like domain
LRQAVLVAHELEPAVRALATQLGLREPYRDPGVRQFGLENAVFALHDCFLEVVSPVRPGTAAGRYLEQRGGDGGYMVMFDLEDLAAARARAAADGVRVVWQIDLPDISGTHLHPADMQGAIVSIDGSSPYGSWRWGGPQWTGRIADDGAPVTLTGVSLAVGDPQAVAERWGAILGVPPRPLDGGRAAALELDGGAVRFTGAAGRRDEGLNEVWLELPEELRAGRDTLELLGVRLRLAPARDAGVAAGARV